MTTKACPCIDFQEQIWELDARQHIVDLFCQRLNLVGDHLRQRGNDQLAFAPQAHTIQIPLNAPPFVRQAIMALDSATSSERKEAIETLMQAKNMVDVCGVLVVALKHPIADVRRNAAGALGEIKDLRPFLP
jgi:hypothetical protein